MSRIALVTPTHLARNPRLVKEADALAESGFDVDVFYARFLGEVVPHDELIEASAAWRAHAVSYLPGAPLRAYSALRQRASRAVYERIGRRTPDALLLRAYERVYPELLRRVSGHRADLYIAHNLQALPVAAAAARKHGALLGFDAEDFHTGMFLPKDAASLARRLVAEVEERFIRRCDYVTAAAPHIAEAYAARYGIRRPVTVLNTFPAHLRPPDFRPTGTAPLTLYWFSQTIGPVRGLEDAAAALSMLADLPIELHLRGQVLDSGYLAYLRALAGRSAGRIVVHDLAPAADMIRLAARFDVGLALETPMEHNRDICLSNKIFSYLGAGNAVLASGTTAQRALMQRIPGAGAVYPPGDARALALILRQWHESRDTLDRCRRRAWVAATERFNWDYEKGGFLRVITGLFDDRRRDPDDAGDLGAGGRHRARAGSGGSTRHAA